MIVGFLLYPDFTFGYKKVKDSESFKRLRKLCSRHFETIVFAEYHWKKNVISKIEQLVVPTRYNEFDLMIDKKQD